MSQNGLRRARFGVFDVDLVTREIRKHGTRVRLQDQPFDVLCALIERPGELVTREDLRTRLWQNDTFVDFDQSVNKAVNKLREALGDSASHPVYIETLARRGYRFLVPVDKEEPADSAVLADGPRPATEQGLEPLQDRTSRKTRVLLATGAVLPTMAIAIGLWPIDVPTVVDVVQLTHDSTFKGAAVSDGVSVIYGGKDVWSIPVSGGEARSIKLPFVSLGTTSVLPIGYSTAQQQILYRSDGTGKDGAELWLAGPEGNGARKVGEVAGLQGSYVALAPQADRLAVSTKDGVYIQSIATGARTKIQHMAWYEPSFLFWHPSGHTVGFVDFPVEDSKTRAWQVNDDASHLGRIVPEREQWQGPGEWSRDGKRFYYPARETGAHSTEIYVRVEAGIAGWLRKAAVAKLTAGGQIICWLGPTIDPMNPRRLYVIASTEQANIVRYERKSGKWVPFLSRFSGDEVDRSPDGQWLAYVKYPGGELHKCRADGSGDLVLARGVFACNPKWSPDGKRIAFAGRRSAANEPLSLWLVSSGGGDAASYPLAMDFGTDAIWAKDGKRILFALGDFNLGQMRTDENRIKVLSLDTGEVSDVPGTHNLFSARWSPDETELVALDVRTAHLHVFDAIKREWREVTNVTCGYPTWSPDGKWIYGLEVGDQVAYRVEVATGRRENIVRLDFPIAANAGRWVGWTGDWDPIVLRDLGSTQIYRIDLDR